MTENTITEKELAEKLESISASMLGLDKKEAWTRVAREAAELMGYEFTPEKPGPGTWHFTEGYMAPAPEVPAYVSKAGDLYLVHSDGRVEGFAGGSDAWPALTPARIIPVAAAPVTLTEDQVGQEWDAVTASDPEASLWLEYPVAHRARFKAVANALLSRYAAPVEGEPIASAAKPIDPTDAQVGDQVWAELHGGDEVTFTVTRVGMCALHSRSHFYDFDTIRSVRLLRREEA